MTKEEFLNHINTLFEDNLKYSNVEKDISKVNYSQRYTGWEYMFKEFFITYNLQLSQWSVYPLHKSSLGFGVSTDLEEAWRIANSSEGLENLLYKPENLSWRNKLINYLIDNKFTNKVLELINLILSKI